MDKVISFAKSALPALAVLALALKFGYVGAGKETPAFLTP